MPELPKFARFWMVCRKPTAAHHKSQPRQRYSNIEDARRTAQTLADQNDAPFIILEAVETARPASQSGSLL